MLSACGLGFCNMYNPSLKILNWIGSEYSKFRKISYFYIILRENVKYRQYDVFTEIAVRPIPNSGKI